MNLKEKEEFMIVLEKSWGLGSNLKWTEENKAKGQCGVTSLVVNDYFGGDILKTKDKDNFWHFYNLIDDTLVDFTKSQYDKIPNYDNVLSNRDEALADTNGEQYSYLTSQVKINILNEVY